MTPRQAKYAQGVARARVERYKLTMASGTPHRIERALGEAIRTIELLLKVSTR